MNAALAHLGAPAVATAIAVLVSSAAVFGARFGAGADCRVGIAEGAASAAVARRPVPRAVDGHEHLERRIAIYRARLAISPGQAPAWDSLAGALRDRAILAEAAQDFARGTEPAGAQAHFRTVAGRADVPERIRAESDRQFAAAWAALYDRLTEEQRDIAVSLPIRHDGRAR